MHAIELEGSGDRLVLENLDACWTGRVDIRLAGDRGALDDEIPADPVGDRLVQIAHLERDNRGRLIVHRRDLIALERHEVDARKLDEIEIEVRRGRAAEGNPEVAEGRRVLRAEMKMAERDAPGIGRRELCECGVRGDEGEEDCKQRPQFHR